MTFFCENICHVYISSGLQRLFQSHHKYKNKKFLFRQSKRQRNFPLLFGFIRELNLYSPLALSLIPRANSKPILPPCAMNPHPTFNPSVCPVMTVGTYGCLTHPKKTTLKIPSSKTWWQD
jgi:hypothetical protein